VRLHRLVFMRKPHVRKSRIFRRPPEESLFPSTLEDEIPADHIVRKLRGLVEGVAAPLRLTYQDKGGVPYDPVGLLCVHLYGFMQGVTSSRVLEDLCRYDSRFKFLTRNLHPDHHTINRLRQRLEGELPQIFASVLTLAREQGLLGMKVVAVDGTKIEGNVSQWKKLVRKANDEEEQTGLSDPEARLMRDRRTGIIRGYNAQLAVDDKCGMIVGYEVSGQAKDATEMPAILASIEDSTGELPETVVADAGYDASVNHAALDEAGVTGIIAPHAPYDSFWDIDSGQVVCPQGHPIQHHRQKVLSNGLYDVYTVRACPSCPLRTQCSPRHLKALSVKAGASPVLRVANAHRTLTPEGKEVLRQRQRIVEPVFGHLKANRGFRRFRLRGRRKVRIEFGLACLSSNLERLLRALLRLMTLLYRLATTPKTITPTYANQTL
jgi:transposase